MNEWKNPEITIGGLPLQLPAFSWTFLPGVSPYVGKIIVNKISSIQLQDVPNPVRIEIRVTGGTMGTPEYNFYSIEELYLVEKKEIDALLDAWLVADKRWLFRGKKIYCCYNKTRIANDKAGYTPASEPVSPIKLREVFEFYGTGRYLDWSVNNGRPYKISEIVQLELQKIGIFLSQGVGLDDSLDYVLENIEYSGVDFYTAMSELLARGRLQMGVNNKGELYIYSVDALVGKDHLVKLNKNRLSAGKIYMQERSRIRPKTITAQFEKLMETRIIAMSENLYENYDYSTPLSILSHQPLWSGKVTIDNEIPREIGCVNVIRIPYETVIGEHVYLPGEYVPINQYLDALGIPLAILRKFWFGDHLSLWYAKKRELETGQAYIENQIFARFIINNIREHYRQVYMIDKYYMTRIRQWLPYRVARIDNYSNTYEPSPVFSDFCLIPNQRSPLFAKRREVGERNVYNYFIDEKDFFRVKPTPGRIMVLNHDLGIFKIFYPPLNDMVVKQIVPSALAKLPYAATTNNIPLLEQCPLSEDFVFDTILSILWYVGKGNDGHISYDSYQKLHEYVMSTNGTGPSIVFVSKKEYARYGVKEWNEEEQQISNGDIINKELVDNIGAAECNRIAWQYMDKLNGIVEVPGFRNILLNGHMVGITIYFGNKGGAKTIIDLRGSLLDLQPETLLKPEHLSFIYRQLPRGEFK